jgi:general stress protein YciG
MNKYQKAGKKGGNATYTKYGSEHMSQIGQEGARVTWERHTVKPVNQSQYAMVRRSDNIIVAIINYRGD